MRYPRFVVASLPLLVIALLPVTSASAQFRKGTPPRTGITNNVATDPDMDTIGTGKVTGSVRTFDGHGVDGARIEARGIDGRNRFLSARADSTGSYAIYNIPTGTYELTVSSGVESARERVQVNSIQDEVNVDFRLPNQASTAPGGGNGTTVSLSQYSIPPKARSLYEKAAQLLTRGRIDESREKVNAALVICPKFPEALTLRGVLQEAGGKRNEAMSDYQQAIQYDPNYPVAYLALASLFNSTARFKESLPLLEHVEKLAPKAWQTYFEMARANIGIRQFSDAIHNLDRATALLGGDAQKKAPEVHLARGYALLGLLKSSEAIQEIEIFLALRPAGHLADNARKVLVQVKDQAVTASR